MFAAYPEIESSHGDFDRLIAWMAILATGVGVPTVAMFCLFADKCQVELFDSGHRQIKRVKTWLSMSEKANHVVSLGHVFWLAAALTAWKACNYPSAPIT